MNDWGQYRVSIDSNMYYYDTLDDACKRICWVLKALNIPFIWDTGIFEKTTNLKKVSKVKKYILESKIPDVKIVLHYKGKEELLSELVLYTLSKYIK